jgi:hypothetical protein
MEADKESMLTLLTRRQVTRGTDAFNITMFEYDRGLDLHYLYTRIEAKKNWMLVPWTVLTVEISSLQFYEKIRDL